MVCQPYAWKLILMILQILFLVSCSSTGIDAVDNIDLHSGCQSSVQMQHEQQQHQQRSVSENQTSTDVCGPTTTDTTSAAAAAASTTSAPPTTTATMTEGVPGTLFLAPSSIPDAGLGVYTIVDIPEGSIVGESDLFIVIEDDHKVLPYRGQQRFLSWLAYVWPRKPDALYPTQEEKFFPDLPKSFRRFHDDGLSGVKASQSLQFRRDGVYEYDEFGHYLKSKAAVNAFAPGLASLANTNKDESLNNIVKLNAAEKRDVVDGTAKNKISNSSAYTPHYRVTFVSTRDIPAGSELFLDYGQAWWSRRRALRKERAAMEAFDKRDPWNARALEAKELSHTTLPTEFRKRRRVDQMSDEVNTLMGSDGVDKILGKERTPNSRVYAHDDDDKYETEYDQEWDPYVAEEVTKERDDEKPEEDPMGDRLTNHNQTPGDKLKVLDDDESNNKNLSWIRKHGVCIDNLQAKPSKIHGAGRGAFTKSSLERGSIIAASPLLVLKRDDLAIYKADKSQKFLRNVLNASSVIGQELLLNYAYGHPDSNLLLLPYAPIVNFINHDPHHSPNAEIRWPSKSSPFYDERLRNDFLSMHPLDVQDWSGPHLKVEFVALRDIAAGEEILIDYGAAWEEAWRKAHYPLDKDATTTVMPFRHEIGVPKHFYPRVWKNNTFTTYQIAPSESPLEPGELSQIRWAHNGKPVAKNLYRVGLPKGFSDSVKSYSDRLGITALYKKFLTADQPILEDNEWQVFETNKGEEQWFAQRHMSANWNFNMHYISAWNERARTSMLGALGTAGFDVALEGTAKFIGLDNMTCWHSSFMGLSQADSNGWTHTDVYSTGEKGFNYIFPILLVDGSPPELDVQTDDFNVVVGVNYEYDVAFALGDFVYHKSRAVEYPDKEQIRIVVGTYCSQINAGDERLTAYIYDGEDPAPFMDQFKAPIKEAHFGNGRSLPKNNAP